MNFRTLLMLGVAALVIVVAMKMNRTPESQSAAIPTDSVPATISGEAPVAEESVMSQDEMDELIYDDMDGTLAPVDTTEDAAPAQDSTGDTTVGDEAVSDEEADQLAPAAVEESPEEALEHGPAERLSDEPVAPSAAPPAAE